MASSSPLAPLLSHLKQIHDAVSPCVVALKCFFSAPRNPHLQKFSRGGTGVFVHRALIVTSAHVVGKVSAERGSDFHNCFIGRNFAVTTAKKILNTKLLAVSFAGDVAVLEAEGDEDLPPHCALSRSVPSKEFPLQVISRHEDCTDGGMIQMKVRACEDDRERTDWPYKIEDGFGWQRYGGEHIEELKIFPGSPWFSPVALVAGIASTAVGNEVADSIGGFVVPPLRIRSVLDYAKRKGPHDPIVIDPWITSPTFSDNGDADLDEECLKNVRTDFAATMYLGNELGGLY